MKRIFLIFLTSLILNFLWENLHSIFYNNYMGKAITEFILFRASFVDAVIVTLICSPFVFIKFFKKKAWLIFVLGIAAAIIIEWFGLKTGRWAYNSYMPVIPFIQVGLTPFLQLGLTGYISYKISDFS